MTSDRALLESWTAGNPVAVNQAALDSAAQGMVEQAMKNARTGASAEGGNAAAMGSPMSASGVEQTAATSGPPRWSDMVNFGARRRVTFHPELVARLKAADVQMAAFKRAEQREAAARHPAYRRRDTEALYFENVKRGNARELHFLLQDLVAPDDREAVMFVDFVGGNVAEVLIDAAYKQDTIIAMKQYNFRYLPRASPLADFLTRAAPEQQQ